MFMRGRRNVGCPRRRASFTARAAVYARRQMDGNRRTIQRSSWRRRCKALPPTKSKAASSSTGKAPRWLIGGSVPRRRWDDPDVDDFLRRGEPLVIEGCPLVASLVGRWSFDYLAENFGDYDKLAVHFAPREETRFSRHYGTGLGKGGCTTMSFAHFVATCKAEHLDATRPSNLRYYLQSPVVWNDYKGERGPHGLPIESDDDGRPLAKAPFSDRIQSDVAGLDWHWLRQKQVVGSCRPFDTCQLWAGHGGGSTPLHFDASSNFLCQVTGRKQVLLFSPAQTWCVYPYPIGHPMDNFAMIDCEAPDCNQFPGLNRARALEAILNPGQTLWLPRFYWHYVHQLDAPSENISLNFWVGQKGTKEFMSNMRSSALPTPEEVDRAIDDAAAAYVTMSSSVEGRRKVDREDDDLLAEDPNLAMACLHSGRMLETAATHICKGDRNKGNQFLNAIAAGMEATWPKDTFGGINGRRMRCELMSVLGAKGANALLRLIVRDGRLYPGLAPQTNPDDYVNSEASQLTPNEEVEQWFSGVPAEEIDTSRRMLRGGGDVGRAPSDH